MIIRTSDVDAWKVHPLFQLLQLPYPSPRECFTIHSGSDSPPLGGVVASMSLHREDLGYLGLFLHSAPDGSEEVLRALLDAACEFLARNGARAAMGPVDLNTWLPYRFATRLSDDLPRTWEPRNPCEWPRLWQDCGFAPAMNYHSRGYDGLAHFEARLTPSYEQALGSGFRFVPIDASQLLDREVPRLHALSMAAFCDNYLFEPLSLEWFRQLYVPLAGKNASDRLQYSCFILAPDGRDAGFSFNFRDGNELILKTIGVLPEFRGQGLSNAAMLPGVQRARQEGVDRWVTALVKEGAQSESYGRLSTPVWEHEYQLLSKVLTP